MAPASTAAATPTVGSSGARLLAVRDRPPRPRALEGGRALIDRLSNAVADLHTLVDARRLRIPAGPWSCSATAWAARSRSLHLRASGRARCPDPVRTARGAGGGSPVTVTSRVLSAVAPKLGVSASTRPASAATRDVVADYDERPAGLPRQAAGADDRRAHLRDRRLPGGGARHSSCRCSSCTARPTAVRRRAGSEMLGERTPPRATRP